MEWSTQLDSYKSPSSIYRKINAVGAFTLEIGHRYHTIKRENEKQRPTRTDAQD